MTETFRTYRYIVRWNGCVLSTHMNKDAAGKAAREAFRNGLLGAYVDRELVLT